jgi:glycosyltransferase involved in cell wall biosynthesis
MADRKDEMSWYSRVFGDLAELRNDGAVVFDPHGPDMAAWYQCVGHILSVSDFEGSHQAVAEGMAAGCVPAIRDWEGAERIYPRSYVAGTVEDLAAMIQRHTSIDIFERESAACRDFAASRFDEVPVCDALLSIIDHELDRLRLQNAGSRAACVGARPTFLIVAYIPLSARSGYRIRVEQEIKILVQLGCIVHLACLLPSSTQDRALDTAELQLARNTHAEEFAALGAHVHLVEIDDFFRFAITPESFPEAVVKLIEIANCSKVDVLHAEALYCARLASVVKARMPRLRFSIDWHGAAPEESHMGGSHVNRVMALESAEKDMFACADLNVFVSESMARHYSIKYSLAPLSQVIVPCCVEDQRFVTPAGTGNSDFRPESLVFAYAGSMADWQCGPEMIKFFAALYGCDARCRFLILAPTSDQEKVLNYAQAASLPEDAYILEAVAHKDVPTRLATAHIGVLLRRADVVNAVSSPTKFGEYLAAGLPVLMTAGIGDFSDLLLREEVGLILPDVLLNDPYHTSANVWLEKIIEQVLHYRSARPKLAKRCQKIASTELQWEVAAMRWLKAYSTDACSADVARDAIRLVEREVMDEI